jgi:hypothetical protein
MDNTLESDSQADKGPVPKPPSVWLAQGLLAAIAILGIIRTFVAPGSSVIQAALCLVLIYVTQKRVAWARWVVSASFVLLAARSQIRNWTSEDAALGREPMQLEVRPDERVGATIGGMFFCGLVVVLAGRVAFGAPARAYFRSGVAGRKASGRSEGPGGGAAA